MKKKKKGSLSDGIYLIVALFAIAIVFIFCWKIFSNINDTMQNTKGISQHGKQLVQSSADKYVNIVDGAFLFIFLGLTIAIIAGAYFIRTHPALFWFSIPIIVFIIFLGAIYTNIFQEIKAGDEIVNYANDFTFIPFIFDNFLYFLVGIILLLAVALFAKNPEIQ